MERRSMVLVVSVMLVILAFSAWNDVHRRHGRTGPGQATATATSDPTTASDDPVVARNRAERAGASWSPSDPVGEDGKPLTLGHVVPGGFEPVMTGTDVQDAVDAGYLQPDTQRPCEGPNWRWAGQLAGGLDVIVGPDKKILLLGLSKPGLETAEGISIGNSYGALKKTYGDRLQGPERMDYGQAGSFLKDGDKWIGFGMDNQPGRLDDDSRIAFIEVSTGTRPGLLRDGC